MGDENRATLSRAISSMAFCQGEYEPRVRFLMRRTKDNQGAGNQLPSPGIN
jgi:hypothetical protein